MHCQRRYSVALYHGTQTLLNVQATGRGVMQILGVQHAHLVPLLGKTRGQDVDKVRFLLSVQRRSSDVCADKRSSLPERAAAP